MDSQLTDLSPMLLDYCLILNLFLCLNFRITTFYLDHNQIPLSPFIIFVLDSKHLFYNRTSTFLNISRQSDARYCLQWSRITNDLTLGNERHRKRLLRDIPTVYFIVWHQRHRRWCAECASFLSTPGTTLFTYRLLLDL
ncbi:hypothetical protein TNIN_324851 [Trichonephila inaurata madagascariensis]|uniref:Uncharacterized protein n=1 Tax=Trichonephila inaurata madagascariensis TaxID=2747483 RepID=A0A8X6XWM9_9ARAC|nr:hypothetical protein TNIN_324851 [Trichonephila inaurata madagascariensis]